MKLLRAAVLSALVVAVVGGRPGRAETVAQLPAKPASYVEDFAGVIDAGSKQQMEELSREVYAKAHATIEVVTIKSLNGDTIDDFATHLEDKWKVGPKGSDKGVLMLYAIQDRRQRIEVGYGLEGILNDAKVGDIGRSMVPQLKQGSYGPAMLHGEQEVAGVIAADAGVTLNMNPAPIPQVAPRPARQHGFNWVGIVLFVLFVLLTFRGGRRGGGGIWPLLFLGNMMGGGFGGRDDDGPGGGGGGDGGGGDFGGGFGGGSGGGGASGDW